MIQGSVAKIGLSSKQITVALPMVSKPIMTVAGLLSFLRSGSPRPRGSRRLLAQRFELPRSLRP